MHASQPTVDEQPGEVEDGGAAADPRPRRVWPASALVFAAAIAALVPTTGDFGLTWDEPAYRQSQVFSAQWWEQWPEARSSADVREILDPDALIYDWPYARFGVNFHPPLGGQLDLLTYKVLGAWMKDVPARRTAGDTVGA